MDTPYSLRRKYEALADASDGSEADLNADDRFRIAIERLETITTHDTAGQRLVMKELYEEFRHRETFPERWRKLAVSVVSYVGGPLRDRLKSEPG